MPNKYCYVENGQVISGPGGLPETDAHRSNLQHASIAELISYGWFPATINETPYNPLTHKVSGQDVVVLADSVIITDTIIALTSAEQTQVAWDAWIKEMAKSDLEDMSREMEDLIEGQHSGSVTNEKLQAKYDAKKVKRAAQPEKPPEPDLPE